MTDNEKTSLYGTGTPTGTGNTNDRTQAYGSSSEKTSIYQDGHQTYSSTHGINVGDTVTLRGHHYRVEQIISEGTGEAVIYKISDFNSLYFALKLYFEFNNVKEEPNAETLSRIKNINDPDILTVHDFGVGSDKYLGKYCYEISTFAEGGDLFSVSDFKAKYTPHFIENVLVKEIFSGIKKLHQNHIYHCDLKPSNIFYRDKAQTDIVIGDYGTAKAIDANIETEIRKTSTIKGTSTFLPPEQARGVISEKNDYYSFGFILLNLLYPEYLSTETDVRQTQKEKFERIIERQYNQMPIIDYNPNHKRLNNLIEGLTLVNHSHRFGKNEVERWLNGEEVDVKYKGQESYAVHVVKLGYVTIKTDKDLIYAVETNPKWHEDLFEDKSIRESLVAWIDSYKDVPSRRVFMAMVDFYRPYGTAYVKEAVLRYFGSTHPVTLEMHALELYTSSQLIKDVDMYLRRMDEMGKTPSIKQMQFYLFQLDFCLQYLNKHAKETTAREAGELLKKLYGAMGAESLGDFSDYKTGLHTYLNQKNIPEAYRSLKRLFYTFNPTRVFITLERESLKTLEELGKFYIRNKEAYDEPYLQVEKDFFLQKIDKKELTSVTYHAFVFEIFKEQSENWVEIEKLISDKSRRYKVHYKYYKSLNTYLNSIHIPIDFTSKSGQSEVYENRRFRFQSFTTEFDHFIRLIKEKHNLAQIPEKNQAELRKKFITTSRRNFLKVHMGQFLAFFIALPSLFLLWALVTHHLSMDPKLNVYWSDISVLKTSGFDNLFNTSKPQKPLDPFLDQMQIKNFKMFSGDKKIPARGKRKYKSDYAFKRSKTKFIYYELNLTHPQVSQKTTLNFSNTIYLNNEVFVEHSFQSYVMPEWTNSTHSAGLGQAKTGYWKKGDYRIDIDVNNHYLGSRHFTVK